MPSADFDMASTDNRYGIYGRFPAHTMRLMHRASIVPCTSFLFGRLGLERVERLDRLARRHLIRIERRQRGDHEVAGLIQGGRTRAWACGRGEQRQVINQPTRM